MRGIAAKLMVWALTSGAVVAQTNFEVASIKAAAAPEGRSLLQAVQGRLMMTNLTLRRVLLIAYGVQDYQLTGDPAWTQSEHYDIEAKAAGNATVQQMEGPMLQALLEDRFQMKLHRETRELPVYELTVGKPGKLQTSAQGSCVIYSADAPPLPPPAPSQSLPAYCGLRLGVDGTNRTLEGKGVSLAVLASSLSRTYNSQLGRNVIDATGLPGVFDIHLKWAIDDLSTAGGEAGIFTALQEQLGLKLRATKGPVEVLVVDHIEKPSPN
jgi:uncharacterized protein (TIGR03435 family)